MEKKLFHMVVVLLLTAVAGSTALAIAPLGPPTAGLEQGQKRIAFEYGYREADLETSTIKVTAWGNIEIGPIDNPDLDLNTLIFPSVTLKDVESNAFLANIGYGATDDWEIYALLGIAYVQIDKVGNEKALGVDGDYDFGYGFGTKYTFRKEESLSWGAMFQMDWTNSEDSRNTIGNDDTDVEIDYYEIVIAVGPTYEINEQLRFYGGPFFFMLDGEYDMKLTSIDGEDGFKMSFDLEEESEFGGYVGAEIDLTENAPLFVEFQFTADSWGFGAGIGWKF